jgi:hypothetical protein
VTASWNLGGERLWIGPEADWHWQSLGKPDFAHYKVPPALDLDIWTVEQSRDGFFAGSVDITVNSAHRDANVKVRLTRSVELLSVENLAPPRSGISAMAAIAARFKIKGRFAMMVCFDRPLGNIRRG